MKHELLHEYPVLYEKPGDAVAHFKATVLVMKNGNDRVTTWTHQPLEATSSSQTKTSRRSSKPRSSPRRKRTRSERTIERTKKAREASRETRRERGVARAEPAIAEPRRDPRETRERAGSVTRRAGAIETTFVTRVGLIPQPGLFVVIVSHTAPSLRSSHAPRRQETEPFFLFPSDAPRSLARFFFSPNPPLALDGGRGGYTRGPPAPRGYPRGGGFPEHRRSPPDHLSRPPLFLVPFTRRIPWSCRLPSPPAPSRRGRPSR